MKTAILIGGTSDIGSELARRLIADDWDVISWSRGESWSIMAGVMWDLVIVAVGTLEPIGKWSECRDWSYGVESNALMPIRMLRSIWHAHAPGASVCLFDGPNRTIPTPSYSAYRCGKALLKEWMECVAHETDDVKLFMLHTGVVQTKIHRQTIEAGKKAANYERVKRIVVGEEETTPHEAIYGAMRYAMLEAHSGSMVDVRKWEALNESV